MDLKPGARDAAWMGVGAVVLIAALAVMQRYQVGWNPSRELESRARRLELVERMRASLASASEAEKSAVLAETDQESKSFADQARGATSEVERLRKALEDDLSRGAVPREKELLAGFSRAFADFQAVDGELLALAVRNSNVKAFALAFGPAAEASQETDAALSRFLSRHRAAPQWILLGAAGARAAALRLQARLAPHIAEQSDLKMTEMEALMQKDDRAVLEPLDALAAQPELRADPDLAAARSSYARFGDLRVQILALSRENTNVRSLEISLNRKRRVTSVCQEALSALQQEIAREPVHAAPANPRQLFPEAPAPR